MRNAFSNLIWTIALSLAVAGNVVHAHSKEEHKENSNEQFDPVTKEFGSYQPGLEPTQTIHISMADSMRFSPASLQVKPGDVVRFVVANEGQLQHEFVLGTAESLTEHAAMMAKFPNMEHDEPYMAHVDPGKEMEIVWQFSKEGRFEFGCLLPGHFDAGMRGTITVN